MKGKEMLCLEERRTKRISLLNCLLTEISSISFHKYGIDYSVLGEGNILTNSLIIGEALEKEEEEQRRIFVGKSGQILRRMLKVVDIENDVFIMNSVPWRPMNNRPPVLGEIKTYSVFIKEVIRILEIKNILFCGAAAKMIFQNDKSMKDILSSVSLNYTFHPVLYFRSNSSDIALDIYTSLLSFSKNVKKTESHYCVFSHETHN